MPVMLACYLVDALDYLGVEAAVDLAGKHGNESCPSSGQPLCEQVWTESLLLDHLVDAGTRLRGDARMLGQNAADRTLGSVGQFGDLAQCDCLGCFSHGRKPSLVKALWDRFRRTCHHFHLFTLTYKEIVVD